MRADQVESQEDQIPLDIYGRLAAATPDERGEIVLGLIEEDLHGRLAVPARDGEPAMLDEIDLSGAAVERRRARSPASASWWDAQQGRTNLRGADLDGASLRFANLERCDLRQANLRKASLGEANLREALLEEANLQGADLAGANLRAAALGGGNLEGAFLEEADLQEAALRFANLQGAFMESANLQRADLWGANLEGADISGATLRGAILKEANLRYVDLGDVDLRGADLGAANLQGAVLTGADLREVTLTGADLQGAVLRDARLQGLDLSDCTIKYVHIGEAWLEKTRLQRKQLGDAIGEELAGQYEEASLGYLALERNFQDLGDPDAASWAYLKKRRMQKLEARKQARQAVAEREWGRAARSYARYATDQIVEWLCDYGESIPRVLGSLLVVYVLFTLIYGITGSVVRVQETPARTIEAVTRRPVELAIFTLVTMTSAEGPSVGLVPRNELVHILTGFQTLLSIALTGLLGFVLGNRIRR